MSLTSTFLQAQAAVGVQKPYTTGVLVIIIVIIVVIIIIIIIILEIFLGLNWFGIDLDFCSKMPFLGIGQLSVQLEMISFQSSFLTVPNSN